MTWRAGLLTAAAALTALGVAYWAQDFRGLVPCPLCLWERWPYRILAALGVLAALSPRRAGRAVLALAIPVALAGAAVAFLHVGVERHWWPSPLPECNSGFTRDLDSSFQQALPATPAPPCDKPVFLFARLPISFAMMDLIYELLFTITLLISLMKRTRRFT